MQSVYDGSQAIDRTPHPMAAFVQYMRIQHGGTNVLVTEQFLDRPDIITGFKEVRGERMPERVAPGMLDHTSPADGLLDGSLKDRLMKMVAPFFPGFRVLPPVLLGKDRTETSMAGEDFPLPWVVTASRPDRRQQVSQERDSAVCRAFLDLEELSNAVLDHASDALPPS
jgi:hypothetical protein